MGRWLWGERPEIPPGTPTRIAWLLLSGWRWRAFKKRLRAMIGENNNAG